MPVSGTATAFVILRERLCFVILRERLWLVILRERLWLVILRERSESQDLTESRSCDLLRSRRMTVGECAAAG